MDLHTTFLPNLILKPFYIDFYNCGLYVLIHSVLEGGVTSMEVIEMGGKEL